jgi:cytochrome c oxidase subunit 2
LQIEVVGHQWWWEFHYPDSNVVTANEVHVPLGRPVNFSLRSVDVLHSFWVPQMGGKMDVIPGHRNHLYFTPEAVGEYHGQCTEFCGIQHANMRFRLVVDSPAEFQAWVQRQQQPAPAQPPSEELLRGQQAFTRSGCIACHTIEGTSAQGTIGPNLTHVGSRSTIGAGILDNTPENVAAWIKDPQAIKPGNLMPNLHVRPDDITAIVTYLESLK